MITLLDLVTPLIKFINRLPKYTKNAKLIGERNRLLIKSISTVKDPEKLIYNDIPDALGMKKINMTKKIESFNQNGMVI